MSTLKQLEEYARKRYIPVMLGDTKELLFNTVKERKPESILEIGTAIGYSGIVMLTAAPESTLNTIEFSEKSVALARKNFAEFDLTDRVNIFVGDAREIVPLLTGKYDFIFLDGPKGQYKAFYPYLTDLLTVGGTLFSDNVLYKGLVENIPEDNRHKHITVARNMRSFLDTLTADKRYETTLYRIGDGVTISRKISE